MNTKEKNSTEQAFDKLLEKMGLILGLQQINPKMFVHTSIDNIEMPDFFELLETIKSDVENRVLNENHKFCIKYKPHPFACISIYAKPLNYN